MMSPEALRGLPMFAGASDEVLATLAADAEECRFHAGDLIVRQHEEAHHLHVLVSGWAQFLIRFEGVDDFLVSTTRETPELIGWSVFRPPYRYTASVRCESACRTVRFTRQVLEGLTDGHPDFGRKLLQRVAAALAARLEDARDMLVERPRPR